MAEAEILERKLKLPEFRAELEAEMEATKTQLRQEKAQKGYVGFLDFRAFWFLQEIGKRDPEFIRELDLTEYVHARGVSDD